MNDNFKDIAELLPEGLSESAVTEVCTLVDKVITAQVEDRISNLVTQVHGFLRLKIDEVKDHAMGELTEENEVFRNSRLYEQIKTLMSIELTEEGDETALASLMKESKEVSEERDLVIDEFNKSLHDNENLHNTVKALSTKIENLEEEKSQLTEEVNELSEAQEKPFKSSEQAKVIAADVDQPQERTVHNNEFLTEEVMKFMPFNS